VKAKYHLWVTPPEKEAMTQVLANCPGEPAVPDSGAPVEAPLKLSEPGEGTSGGGGGYSSCDEARADGAAPVHRGEPGYSTRLDGDGDGVACE
jgi:hypothetical protein